ncbi:hypothetical protein PRIC1_003960 [Phytophthora ramorum]
MVIVQADSKYSSRLPPPPASLSLMKMTIATIAVTLAYLGSLVLAADQPSMMESHQASITSGIPSDKLNAQGNIDLASHSNILISETDRAALAYSIEDKMASSPDAMTSESLFGLLARAGLNPTVFTNAAGLVSAARRGDTGALAGHVVGLLGAVAPPTHSDDSGGGPHCCTCLCVICWCFCSSRGCSDVDSDRSCCGHHFGVGIDAKLDQWLSVNVQGARQLPEKLEMTKDYSYMHIGMEYESCFH